MTNTGVLDVDTVVVPILDRESGDVGPQPLGTGFFVGEDPVLVTCYHVIEHYSGQLAIALREDLSKVYFAEVLAAYPELDLAILKVPGYNPPQVLPLAPDDDHHGNVLVSCHEHSQTRKVGKKMIFSAASRVGNITRSLMKFDLQLLGHDYGGKITALEVSFPTLRGASGAPVFTNDGRWQVLGILTGNVGHEYMPHHIESVYDPDTGVEVEDFKSLFVPQGIAIHVKHLRPLVS